MKKRRSIEDLKEEVDVYEARSRGKVGYDIPSVHMLQSKLASSRMAVERWAPEQQESRDELVERAKYLAEVGLKVAKKTGDMGIAYEAVRTLATVDPNSVISGDYARHVEGEVEDAYKIGKRVAPTLTEGFIGKIRKLEEDIREQKRKRERARALEEEAREYAEKGYVHRRTGAACILGALAGAVLLASGITGNAIGSMSVSSSKIVGAVLFFVGIVGSIISLRKTLPE